MQKILEKLLKLRKNCNHKRNINRIYNKKLHYNYPQQLPTLKLKTYPTAFSPPGGAKCPHKKKKKTYVTPMKGNEKLNIEPRTESSHEKFNFVVILLKIAKKQPWTFTSNQHFPWNLVNFKYILQKIVTLNHYPVISSKAQKQPPEVFCKRSCS